VNFISDSALAKGNGQYMYDGIHLSSKGFDKYVATHELGHVLQGREYARNNATSPANMLATGDPLTDYLGNHITGLEGGNFERTDRGYQNCSPNDACRYEEHPRYKANGIETVEGNTPGEDVADMFLNWVYNSFDYGPGSNGAGQVRYDWFDVNIVEWVR
jgi:hypothetical protein